MFYRFLTKDEKDHIRKLKEEHEIEAVYKMELESYLRKINYSERLQDYLKDKWFVKLIRFFANLKKKFKK